MAWSSALVVCLTAASAFAAEYAVNTTQDLDPDGSCDATDCTLREALLIAGAAGGTDTIIVPAGTYVLSRGQLTLNGDTIAGAGARTTVINGNGARVLSATGTSAIAGVTITGGQDQQAPGGGVVVSGNLQMTNSHVTGNTAPTGGGLYVPGTLTMIGSTVAGNRAQALSGSQGGGIAIGGEGRATLVNSTVAGNVAQDSGGPGGQGGGIYVGNTAVLALSSVTVAGNQAAPGGGGGLFLVNFGATQLINTIVDENGGDACAGAIATIAAGSHHNLVQDGTCALQGPGNLQGTSAQLLGLGNYGGPTDTRAVTATSPARNTGSDCGNSDQRGVARPQGGACDIGAFEYVAPTLTVTTTVINNDGGEDGPPDFRIHVRDAANADVAGSPQPGTPAGTTFTLAPGAFKVSAAGPMLYSIAVGGACSPAGDIVLGENQSAACTITADDRAPRAGREVGVLPTRGRVRIRRPGGKWQRLTGAGIMPNNTRVDTRKGRVTLVAAANRRGRETKADFYDGIFKLRQSKAKRPLTTLTLIEAIRCTKAGKASTAAKKKKRKRKRRLWGNGRGRFRTKGRHSAATVVGTKWLVEDRCKRTVTRVVRGRVKVRDFVKKKTITVRRGKRYIARARSG